MSDLEKLCQSISENGIEINLRRKKDGVWMCSLYFDSPLYSTPMGLGRTAIEAVNAACDQRLELLLRDGN